MSVPDLKRITYFNGQRLTAGDLNDATDSSRELRWLHNRSLHGWGIASGLQVSGKIGDRSVTVSPGYGVDDLGREIILASPAVSNVPAVSAHGAEVEYFLVISWVSDDDESVVQSRPGVCSAGGAVRLSDAPLLAWRSRQDLHEGRELILAQLWIRNCRLSRAISTAARRYARPSQQPYIASGVAEAAILTWATFSAGGHVVGLQADVDTSSGQFGGTPQYFAQLSGEHYLPGAPGPLLAVVFAAAVNARPDGFTFQAMLPQGPGIVNLPAILDITKVQDIMKALQWQVVWMGVEA